MYSNELMASGIIAFILTFSIVFIFGGLILYILSALGLQKLASNKNIENPWFAWIPFLNLYLLALIIEEVKISDFEIPYLKWVLPLAPIAVAILNGIPLIGFILDIALIVFLVLVYYSLYKCYRPNSAVLYTILSIILPFMGPIFMFVIRNDTFRGNIERLKE